MGAITSSQVYKSSHIIKSHFTAFSSLVDPDEFDGFQEKRVCFYPALLTAGTFLTKSTKSLPYWSKSNFVCVPQN